MGVIVSSFLGTEYYSVYHIVALCHIFEKFVIKRKLFEYILTITFYNYIYIINYNYILQYIMWKSFIIVKLKRILE